jgi:hypothetical protein
MRETPDEVVLVLGNFSETPKPKVTFAGVKSVISDGWTLREELENVEVSSPRFTDEGGFSGWEPLVELAPESIYVLRWRR